MGKGMIRNRCLATIFWFKVLVAISISLAGMVYLSSKVYYLHQGAITAKGLRAAPIIIDATSKSCLARQNGRARLEPIAGKVLTGFHLNWQLQVPTDIQKITGTPPAICNAFLQLSASDDPPIRWADFVWHGQQVGLVGGIFALTIEPIDIANIPQEILEAVAKMCLDINKSGVPMMLRYGHEMNGDWTDYGLQPVAYIAGFRRMALTLRRYTNLTAMVWGPNAGVNYPFDSFGTKDTPTSKYPTMAKDPANFRALDTNNDGLIDWRDDPYGPYYPGDDVVDWVGMSLYWYPDTTTGFNLKVPPTFFVDQILGYGPTIELYNPQVLNDGGLRNFYQRFSASKNKPFIIPETAAPFVESATSPNMLPESIVKEQWWSQLYSEEVRNKFPLLKAIVHFEEKKGDFGATGRDWRVLADRATRDLFIKDELAIKSRLLYANNLKYGCDGSLETK